MGSRISTLETFQQGNIERYEKITERDTEERALLRKSLDEFREEFKKRPCINNPVGK